MRTYLVTGGAGFIGSHITTALVERGDRVRVLDDLSSGRLDNLGHLDVGAVGSGTPVELLRGSVVSPEDCAAACAGVRGVFHEAAQVSVPESVSDPEKSLAVNVLGTMRVLEAARRAGVEGLVFAASSKSWPPSPPVRMYRSTARRRRSPDPLPWGFAGDADSISWINS